MSINHHATSLRDSQSGSNSQSRDIKHAVANASHPYSRLPQIRRRITPSADVNSRNENIADIWEVSATEFHESLNANAKKRKYTDDQEEEENTETQENKKRKLLNEELTLPSVSNKRLQEIDFSKRRIKDILAGKKPTFIARPQNQVKEAIRRNPKTNKDYKVHLKSLPTQKPSLGQLARLEEVKAMVPNYFGRTASRSSGFKDEIFKRCSNGYTGQRGMLPAAATKSDRCTHAKVKDLSQGELIYMLAHHLMWSDKPDDEFLSFSRDMLFLIVHALNRFYENQGNVTIQFCDRRKAQNAKGEQTAFYPALKLVETFNVLGWNGWTTPQRQSLYPRKFTHELLSHGITVFQDFRFGQASVKHLIRDGLYEIFPALQLPPGHSRADLYTSVVHYRTVGYPPDDQALKNNRIYSYDNCAKVTPFTRDFLIKVKNVAMNFMRPADPEADSEPHLHVFLSLLTFEKRLKNDAVFLEWIREHYTAEDVRDLYDDGIGGVRESFARVAENVPGIMQYLDLVYDASSVFDLPHLPPRRVETTDTVTGEIYADEDARLQRNCIASFIHKEAKEARRKAEEQAKENALKRRKREQEGVKLKETNESEELLPNFFRATLSLERNDNEVRE